MKENKYKRSDNPYQLRNANSSKISSARLYDDKAGLASPRDTSLGAMTHRQSIVTPLHGRSIMSPGQQDCDRRISSILSNKPLRTSTSPIRGIQKNISISDLPGVDESQTFNTKL